MQVQLRTARETDPR